MKSGNVNSLIKAECILGDYFSQFGGGNRPTIMNECDIGLIVIIETINHFCSWLLNKELKYELDECVNNDVINSSTKIIDKFREAIKQIDFTDETECLDCIKKYYEDRDSFDAPSEKHPDGRNYNWNFSIKNVINKLEKDEWFQ